MERVVVIKGSNPWVFLAPHGYDDKNTDIIAEAAAESTNGFAIINKFWERSDQVNENKSLANCNNMTHLQKYVVQEEFYNPIKKIEKKVFENHKTMLYVSIHGCGNDVKQEVNSPITGILGYGAGSPSSYSCSTEMRCTFNKIIDEDGIWKIYHAKAGSRFSGWQKNNLNQLWRKHTPNKNVQGFQLELTLNTRNTILHARQTGIYLGKTIKKLWEREWGKDNLSNLLEFN